MVLVPDLEVARFPSNAFPDIPILPEVGIVQIGSRTTFILTAEIDSIRFVIIIPAFGIDIVGGSVGRVDFFIDFLSS